MVREIVRDTALLRQPSLPATRKDGKAADDLLATLKATRRTASAWRPT